MIWKVVVVLILIASIFFLVLGVGQLAFEFVAVGVLGFLAAILICKLTNISFKRNEY